VEPGGEESEHVRKSGSSVGSGEDGGRPEVLL